MIFTIFAPKNIIQKWGLFEAVAMSQKDKNKKMGLFYFFYLVCNSFFFLIIFFIVIMNFLENSMEKKIFLSILFTHFPRVFGRMFMTHVWPKFQVNFANLTLTFFCIIFCVIFCLRQIITLRVSSSLCLHSFGYTCRATIYVGLTKNEGPLSILKGVGTSSLLARLQNKQKRSYKKVTENCSFLA